MQEEVNIMNEKSTYELDRILDGVTAEQFEDYNSRINSDTDTNIEEYFNSYIGVNKLELSDVVKKSDIPATYAYGILNGSRRNPSRDRVIALCIACEMDFDLQAVIKKAKKLDMAGALLLVGDKYIASIGSTIISYSNLNDFPIFVISGEIPLVDIFEEIGHAIAYNKDSDVLSDDILSGIIFGKDINIEAFSIKFEEAGYDINGNNRMFMINIHSDNKIENFDYDFIMNKLRDSFAQNNGSLILSRYANNIVGCFNCLENADDTHGLINQSYEALSEYVQGRYTDIKLVMGIGREYNGISHLQKSFTCITVNLTCCCNSFISLLHSAKLRKYTC